MTTSTELDLFIRQCLTDTGFVCRNLLGWNYDEVGRKRINVGTGGFRRTGPHQRMVEILDNRDLRYKHIEMPRGAYKSTGLQGFCVRLALEDPNVRILYGMKGDEKATEKSLAIRNAFELPKVVEYFGQQRGEKWEDNRFTVATRTQTNLAEPTFSTFSLNTPPTGGHYDYIILDDLIDWENCRTPNALAHARRIVELLPPLLTAGGQMIWVGTRYDEQDIYNDLLGNPLFYAPTGATLVVDAGVEVVQDSSGQYDLAVKPGGITFPHLSIEILRERLHQMSRKGDTRAFCCQYLNYVPTGLTNPFQRHWFQPIRWRDDMSLLSGYLVTDTAVSEKREGCYSVLGYVGLDKDDRAYLLDLEVGHFRAPDLVERFVSMLRRWQLVVNHQGECWEDVSWTSVFSHWAHTRCSQEGVKMRKILMPRRPDQQKLERIRRMEGPMRDNRLFVVTDRVPSRFTDLDGERSLFDPEGYKDGLTGRVMPGGELVDEFMRFESPSQKVDIPDALSMIWECAKDGTRYCRYRKPSTEHVERTRREIRDPRSSLTVVRQEHDYSTNYLERLVRQAGF